MSIQRWPPGAAAWILLTFSLPLGAAAPPVQALPPQAADRTCSADHAGSAGDAGGTSKKSETTPRRCLPSAAESSKTLDLFAIRTAPTSLPLPNRQLPANVPPISQGAPPLASVRSVYGEILEPAATPALPDSWKTGEYNYSVTVGGQTGRSRLNLINAAEGYARRVLGRVGGGGITVAVIDDGINAMHEELDVAKAFEYTDHGTFGRTHGTQMASLIAARRNGSRFHGVAYNANLISLARASLAASVDPTIVDASAADIASAAGLSRTYGTFQSDPTASSHILNMSWGFMGKQDAIRSAMRDAAEAGRIMVSALGNSDNVGPNGAPAIYSADAGIAGFALAVGWLNESGTGKHIDSNTCGSVAHYCLFAPGTLAATATAALGYGVVSGTSISTALVSGAAAVVWAAFPNKRSDQIVGRLLSTARPLDGNEISSVFGHGVLDLGAAMNPVGFLSLPTAAGMAPLASSFVVLTPGFAAPAWNAALANAVAYDQQMFPFLEDLNALFRTVDSAYAASPALLSNDAPNVASYRAAWQLAPDVSIVVAKGFGSAAIPVHPATTQLTKTALADGFVGNPFDSVVGWGDSVGLSWTLDARTALSFVGKRGGGYFGAARTRLASADLRHRVGKLTLGVSYGVVDETKTWLGVRAEGAFGAPRNGRTHFFGTSASAALSARATLFGRVSQGVTDGGAGSGLLARWSKAQSQAILLGGAVERLWLASDRLVIAAAMPMRVRRANILLDVADYELTDGIVQYARHRLSLAPQGREVQWQLAYAAKAFRQRLSFTASAMLRRQPNHRADSDSELGAALELRFEF